MHFFRLTDSIRQTYLHISYVNSEKSYSPLVLVFNANEIKIVEFIQESVFMHRKPCAAIESEFDVWIWKLYSLSSIPPTPRHTHTHTHTHAHTLQFPNQTRSKNFSFKHQRYCFLRMFRNYTDQNFHKLYHVYYNIWTIYWGFFLTT